MSSQTRSSPPESASTKACDSLPREVHDLMNAHLREEGLPEATMPVRRVDLVLKGQKALVTGANSGIGKAVALALAHAGADVVVNYVSRPDAADEVVREAELCGVKAFAHKANVAKEDEVQGMFQKMVAEFGTIDILVNNAGVQKDAPIDQMSLADWRFVLEVNLTGQFLCAREAIREFKTARHPQGGFLRGRQDHLHEQRP